MTRRATCRTQLKLSSSAVASSVPALRIIWRSSDRRACCCWKRSFKDFAINCSYTDRCVRFHFFYYHWVPSSVGKSFPIHTLWLMIQEAQLMLTIRATRLGVIPGHRNRHVSIRHFILTLHSNNWPVSYRFRDKR